MQGWVKLHRQLMEWEWYDDSETLHLFIHLLLSANHEDGEWHGHKVSRGQHITSIKSLSQKTGISEKKIRLRLKRLEKTGEISLKSGKQFTVVKVNKYDTFQPTKTEEGRTKGTRRAHEGHTKGTQRATNKNEKNEENEKNDNNELPQPSKIGRQHIENLAKQHGLDLNYVKIQKENAAEYYDEKGKQLTLAKLNAWLANDSQSKLNPSNPNRITPPYLTRRLA